MFRRNKGIPILKIWILRIIRMRFWYHHIYFKFFLQRLWCIVAWIYVFHLFSTFLAPFIINSMIHRTNWTQSHIIWVNDCHLLGIVVRQLQELNYVSLCFEVTIGFIKKVDLKKNPGKKDNFFFSHRA